MELSQFQSNSANQKGDNSNNGQQSNYAMNQQYYSENFNNLGYASSNYNNMSNNYQLNNRNYLDNYQEDEQQQQLQSQQWSRFDENQIQQGQQSQFVATLEEKMMPPLEKIQSGKWQLRKIGYQEIQQVFVGGFGEDSQESAFEHYAPWLSNIVNEKNLIALTEGLKSVDAFISNYKGPLSNQILKYYLGDLIEKAPLFKHSQQQIAIGIVNNSLLKGDPNFAASEISKRLESTHPKIVQFGLLSLKNALEYQLEIQKPIFIDETMRTLFLSNLALLKNTNKEIRSTAMENLRLIYIQSRETVEEIEKTFLSGQRSVHLRDIQDLLKKAKKTPMLKFRLIQETSQKNCENEKSSKSALVKGQKYDLSSVLPEKFFEIPYLLQIQQKKLKLEQFWQNMQKHVDVQAELVCIRDSKDYSNIFNVLILCLEESNFLVFSEALRCVKSLMKLMKNRIPLTILKHFLALILDQFRGAKARQYNTAVWQALDDCYFNSCCTYEQLVEILLMHCENEKNLNTRIGCINWLGGRFIPLSEEIVKDSIDLLNIDTQIQSQRGEKLRKLIDGIDKRIEAISKKALNIQLKEAAQNLLARKGNEYFNEYDKENNNNNNNNNNNSNISNVKIPSSSKLTDQPEKSKPAKHYAPPRTPAQPFPTEGNVPSTQKRQTIPPKQSEQQYSQQPSTSQSSSSAINLLEMDIQDSSREQPKQDKPRHYSPPIVTRRTRMDQHLAVEAQRQAMNHSEISQNDMESYENNILKQLSDIKMKNYQGKSNPNNFQSNNTKDLSNVSNEKQHRNYSSGGGRRQNELQSVQEFGGYNNNVMYSPQEIEGQSYITSRHNSNSRGQNVINNNNNINNNRERGNQMQKGYQNVPFNNLDGDLNQIQNNIKHNPQFIDNYIDQEQVAPNSMMNGNQNNNIVKSNRNSEHNNNHPSVQQTSQYLPQNIINQVYENQSKNQYQNPQSYSDFNSVPVHNDNNNNYSHPHQRSQSQNKLTSFEEKRQFEKYNQHYENNLDGQFQNNNDHARLRNRLFQDDNDDSQDIIHPFQDKIRQQQRHEQEQNQEKELILDDISNENGEQNKQCYYNNNNNNDQNYYDNEHVVLTEKSEAKTKRRNDRNRMDSISPIMKQFDQLSSNRHYYGSQEGKLNLSEMSCPSIHPSNMHNNIISHPFNEEPWHIRYKEERDMHLKAREELEKAEMLMEQKQIEEKQLLEKLAVEKKEKLELANKVEILQKQQEELEKQQQDKKGKQQDRIMADLALQGHMNSQKINGVSLQEQYHRGKQMAQIIDGNPAKSPLNLVPVKLQEKLDCLKQLQEILLTSEQLYNDLGEAIILHYEELEEVMDKIEFVIDLKLAVIDQVLLENMSENNFRVVFMIALRLCTAASTQKEISVDKDQRTYRQNDLTRELQTLLDALLSSKPTGTVIISGVKILNSAVSTDLTITYPKNQKMLFRLILKCLEKLLANEQDLGDLRAFEILTEIYKFFKCHPPEALDETLPSLKDLEFIFRQLKSLADKVVNSNVEKAHEFVEFIYSKHHKSIFIDYLRQLIQKIYENYKPTDQ